MRKPGKRGVVKGDLYMVEKIGRENDQEWTTETERNRERTKE